MKRDIDIVRRIALETAKLETGSGCEFADSVQDETLWSKAKEKVIKPSASFSFGILKDWLGAEIRDGFPTLRG